MNYFPMPNAMYPHFPMGGRAPFQPTVAPALYIGNLDDTVHEEQLFAHFSRYGPLNSLKIVKDRTTGRSRGFGYINFMNAKDAENARMLAQYDKIGKSPIRLMYKRNVHANEGTNVFVKNIDPTVSFKELHNFFARLGNVITVKIATNNRGESLGYGYVLMDKKEEAEQAITELNGAKLKEREITCCKFEPRDRRKIGTNNNLYVKGLPSNLTEEAVKDLIVKTFEKYGQIESSAVKSKDGKYFAFVCYKNAEEAQEAIKNLNDTQLPNTNEPLYVAKHQSRHERDIELKKNHQATKNDTNLFLRNLKPEITKEQLEHAFREFGEVGNTACGTKTIKNDDVRGYGFVSFKMPQDALKAQTDGPKSEEVRKLFIEGQDPYINFWQPKSQRDQFKLSKTRRPFDPHRMQPFPIPRGNPFGQMPTDPRMMNFPPFPMMNPNMMRGPYGNPRPQNVQGRYPPKRGGYQQGGRNFASSQPHTHGQKPNTQHVDRSGRPYNKPQHPTNRPDQRAQGGHQQQTQQQPKETRTTPAHDVALEANLTVQSLKDKLEDFLKLEPEKQRNILGELLYPKIVRRSNPQHAPKITGMLVDFEVLTVQDILEMLEDDQILDERIEEAQELITSEGQNMA